MITNEEFLRALFGEDYQWAHVTGFTYDPSHIPADQHLRAWCGDYFSRYKFTAGKENRYFTVSTFYADEKGKARRRKALFRSTHVIVLDDVKEKLPLEQVQKLPPPTWVLETSPGSEQWGYLLDTPCTDRIVIENLVDGLIVRGLSPSGKDPGMRGVTRYVRLPVGWNTKASKCVNGEPQPCRLLEWAPYNVVTVEEMSAVFSIDLHAQRREAAVDGAREVDDHPLMELSDLVHIKSTLSAGRYDITCPWVDEHTQSIDNGTAFFTNGDGSMGFKCHHGSCQNRTGKDFLAWIENSQPGFTRSLSNWRVMREFKAGAVRTEQTTVSAVGKGVVSAPPRQEPSLTQPSTEYKIDDLIAELRKQPPFFADTRDLAARVLKVIDSMPAMEKQHWNEEVRQHMRWSKSEFKTILSELRETWYIDRGNKPDFYGEVIFVNSLNQFYNADKKYFLTPDAYQNAYAHLASDARKDALQGGLVMKVDKLTYSPNRPQVYTRNGVTFGNTWEQATERAGYEGDVTAYLEHFDRLGWGHAREHLLRWMAFTIVAQDRKINHMIILGSNEGAGKDFILAPMVMALGDNSRTIEAPEFLTDNVEYTFGVKHLHINEVELADHAQARMIANRVKPLAAAPPKTLRVNPKNVRPFDIDNIISLSMTTNSPLPFRIHGPTRRTYPLWTDWTCRDENDETPGEWQDWWGKAWEWMEGVGGEAMIYYLRNSVDLSKFNPGSPPPVTEFLREMREASMSPHAQMLQSFIAGHYGAFDQDLATAAELSTTLRMAPLIAPEMSYVQDCNWFTPTKIGVLLKEMGFAQRRAYNAHLSNNLYILRDRARYSGMSGSDLWTCWQDQKTAVGKSSKLKAITGGKA